MAVDNHGIEALKLAAEQVTAGSDADYYFKVASHGGTNISPLSQYLELTLTSATVETYEYYESSSKATLYNTIVVTYADSTKATIVSVEWS